MIRYDVTGLFLASSLVTWSGPRDRDSIGNHGKQNVCLGVESPNDLVVRWFEKLRSDLHGRKQKLYKDFQYTKNNYVREHSIR